MKKLAYIVTQSELGGAQKNILLLSRALKEKYEIILYTGPGGLLIDEVKAAGIEVVVCEDFCREINLIKDLKAFRFLVKEFSVRNFDIVHGHSSKAGFLSRIAASRAGVRVNAYTAHGFVFNEPMSRFKKWLYMSIESYASKLGTDLIMVSDRDLKLANELGFGSIEANVHIPNGIDFPEKNIVTERKKAARSSLRREYGIGDDSILFGTIANFYETKGHRYLVEAFNTLVAEYRDLDLRLMLIGQGELLGSMRNLAAGNIIFTGYLKDAEVMIDSFDCLVLPSVKEGFPFVILEGIKHMVPIIATDVGDVKLVLESGLKEASIIIGKESSDEILAAMKAYMADRNSMTAAAEAAYDIMKDVYSLDRMVTETEKVYERRLSK
jgi:glycosyltransferase involved in cell wall biosynthesis